LPTSRLLALPESEFEHFLQISVLDDGVGIAPDEAPRLFKAFSQLDGSLSRSNEGTGLGLALILNLARLHQGTVAFESQPEKGSRFIIWLPWR
jgi:signal transduction histidine kinase